LTAVDARRVTATALGHVRDILDREPGFAVVAAGKAAVGMAAALDAAYGSAVLEGVMTAAASAAPSPRWRTFAATHPEPGEGSVAAGLAALELADRVRTARGLLLVCLSGGASAMLAAPAPGLTLADKAATTQHLLRAGLDIGALNAVRRHLSAIKGGQLAARAGRSVTLAISDVCTPIEDDPRIIGSGPTAGDDSSFADALRVVEAHGLTGIIPAAALGHLQAGARGEVSGPVPADDPCLRQAAYWIIASRKDAMRAAAVTAQRLGYHVQVEQRPLVGEARVAGAPLVDRARQLPRPACLIASGETTVRVTGRGRGGRNQELALAALESLAALEAPAALASLGTDGVDGPTDAAGAFVDASMWDALGADPRSTVRSALDNNDAYPLLDRLDALKRTGPTGTNVGDLQVVLIGEAR
jgi:hydroxypyruvate reductase